MENYGASIEIGEIVARSGNRYAVRSCTRYGLVTPPIPALGDAAFEAGERVYFFLFEDGHGMILAAYG